MTIEQIIVSIITILLIPLALWYFQRIVSRRDSRIEHKAEAEQNIVNVKLDSIADSMKEFREDIRADIKILHSRVGDFKESNDCAHKEIWTETNRLRERVAGVESRHEVIIEKLKDIKGE